MAVIAGKTSTNPYPTDLSISKADIADATVKTVANPVNKTTTTTPVTTGKQTTYYDPTGSAQTGYIINDKTYKDASGTQRIDVGSLVQTGDNWWKLTDQGGVKIDNPYLKDGKAEELTTGPVNQYDLENFMTPKENQLYGLIDKLTNSLLNYQQTPTMSRDEATARATAQLRQPFEQSLADTMKQYDQSAIQRGMFGQLPTEVLKQKAIASTELGQQSAIQDLAGNMFQQDFQMGQSKDQQNLNLVNQQLEAVSNTLFNEKAKKTEIQDAKAAISTAKSAEQQASIDNAYKRWESLGYADEVVANALGIDTGTPSQANMEQDVKSQYAMKLEEYKTLLALQEAQNQYGFDVSLAGYKSGLNMSEAAQKLQLDLVKLAQAANIDITADLAKTKNEYDLKKDYESFMNQVITPELKLDLFQQAIDMSNIDPDKQQLAIDILKQNATGDSATLDFEEALKEYDQYFKGQDINKIMDAYNGLLNVIGGQSSSSSGVAIPESDYSGSYSNSNPLRSTK